MATIPPPGKIITFYSYKGGTGRSMALANVGYLLAETLPQGSRGILMIDWDLEAPGLHRYFEDSLKKALRTAQRSGIRSLALQPGLIDFFESADSGYGKDIPSQSADELEATRAKSRSQALASFPAHVLATDFDNLYLLKAGRFDDEYPERIRKFDWERFHSQDPGFFREFRHFLMEKYDYVLIDSRTGLTDTSGICVQQMPEKLVLVFVPNNQNIDGVLDVIRRVRRFRIGSSDLRPLVSFPLASRIDGSNERLRAAWRNGGKLDGDEIPGYQKVFEDLFEELYELDECDLNAYFDATQIKHDSDYAFGEKIAVRRGTSDRLSLGYAFANFTQRLTTLSVPWESLPEEQEIETAKRRELAASAREEKARSKVKLITVISAAITLLALVAALVSFDFSRREYGKAFVFGGVAPVDDVSFSPDCSRIATALVDGTVQIWKADRSAEPIMDSSCHRSPLVVWSPDQKSLLTICESTVRTWDLQTSRVDTVVTLQSPPLIAASFNPAGQILAVDRDGVLYILDKTTGKTIYNRSLLNRDYTNLNRDYTDLKAQFGLNGTIVAVSSSSGTIVLNLGPELTRFPLATKLPDDSRADAMAFSPDGRYLVTSTRGRNRMDLWDLHPVSYPIVFRSSGSGFAEAMELSPNGQFLAVAGSDGTTSVYDRSALRTLPNVLRGVGAVKSLCFSSDSKRLAIASDSTVQLWNLDSP
jgi:cellulose biosynthesis protein BcsQ/sugar lactone lactonase YvrE